MFLRANGEEFDKHMISPDLYSPPDHALLSVNIIIEEKFTQDKRQTIVKNSIDEANFVNELKNRVGHINSVNISDCKINVRKNNIRIHIYYRRTLDQAFETYQYYQML